MSTTRINIVGIAILLRECVVVHRTITTTHVTHLKIIINYQWRKIESAGNFSLDFSSVVDFILLQTHDGGLDGMDVSANVILLLLFILLLPIPSLCGIVKKVELVVC